MLSKMGWKEGQGLGATQAASAITTPVTVGIKTFPLTPCKPVLLLILALETLFAHKHIRQ
jgi:hypothetical protein